MKRKIRNKVVIGISALALMLSTVVINPSTVSAATTAPWSKNEQGQFVNGNGDVLEGATMKGIDVSKWNGDINWAKVAATDVGYAIIRCGYGDNYTYQDDTYWKKNVEGCEKNNIPYGVYIYSYAETTKQAKSEAEHVLRLVEGHTINFPIYLDVEDKVQQKLSKSQLTNIINTFATAIRGAGYECGVYANLNWWTNYIDNSIAINQNYFKWVAQYNNVGTTYPGVYQMWQCTENGKVNGINGNVDLNFWFGEVRDRSYNARRINIQQPTVVTAPPVKKVKAPGKAKISKLTKAKKKTKISIKKVTGAKGYQIQYSTKNSFKKKYTKTKETTKRTVTIKKLTSKKTYYFRVKAYKLDGKTKVYSKKWSKVKKVKVK